MIPLLLMLALQAPIEEEVDMLRARMRAAEHEITVLTTRMDIRVENEAAEAAKESAMAEDEAMENLIDAIQSLVTLILGGGLGKLGYDRYIKKDAA